MHTEFLLELVSASCFDPQVQKKAFIENTVPLIISLKTLLEQKRSPVLRDLMAYLQVRHESFLRKSMSLMKGELLI